MEETVRNEKTRNKNRTSFAWQVERGFCVKAREGLSEKQVETFHSSRRSIRLKMTFVDGGNFAPLHEPSKASKHERPMEKSFLQNCQPSRTLAYRCTHQSSSRGFIWENSYEWIWRMKKNAFVCWWGQLVGGEVGNLQRVLIKIFSPYVHVCVSYVCTFFFFFYGSALQLWRIEEI